MRRSALHLYLEVFKNITAHTYVRFVTSPENIFIFILHVCMFHDSWFMFQRKEEKTAGKRTRRGKRRGEGKGKGGYSSFFSGSESEVWVLRALLEQARGKQQAASTEVAVSRKQVTKNSVWSRAPPVLLQKWFSSTRQFSCCTIWSRNEADTSGVW